MTDGKKLVITGALAGAANGLFGSGGGLFLVPLFIGWMDYRPREAFATSVAVIFCLSAVSAVVYWIRGGQLDGQMWPYLVGGALGGIIAGKLFDKIQMKWLRKGFALLLLYAGVRAVLGK